MQQPKALVLGAFVGFLIAIFPACGGTTSRRCTASNCDGCCDDQGVCQLGDKLEACGSSGASCAACMGTGVSCQRVSSSNPYGGECKGGTTVKDGGTGGGSAGTGGGSAGTGGGSTGPCNATTCANGCCTASGACITMTTPSRCGAGGAACMQCNAGNYCNAGACAPCAGCIDVNTGACAVGTDNTACGKNGAFCTACDTASGNTCTNNACIGNGTCNATNCANGCCDGNTCKPQNMYTNAQCGTGTPGAACTTCQGIAQCDLDAGICVGGAGGGGGGFPSLDGGIVDLVCALTCPGKCCEIALLFPTCSDPGNACKVNILSTCDATSLKCQ